jgi:hypothetical protein
MRLRRFLLPALLALGFAGPSRAAVVILQPIAISSPQGSAASPFELEGIIDQSGLSSPYTSGVTDFDTYTASTTHNSAIDSNSGFIGTPAQAFPEQITFDLGSVQTIESIAFWASVGSSGSVTQFRLFQDDDSDLSNGMGSQMRPTVFALANTDAGFPAVRIAQVFAIPETTTRYVHMFVDDTEFGLTHTTSIGEVAFGQTVAVPEVESQTKVAVALLIISGCAALYRRRPVLSNPKEG